MNVVRKSGGGIMCTSKKNIRHVDIYYMSSKKARAPTFWRVGQFAAFYKNCELVAAFDYDNWHYAIYEYSNFVIVVKSGFFIFVHCTFMHTSSHPVFRTPLKIGSLIFFSAGLRSSGLPKTPKNWVQNFRPLHFHADFHSSGLGKTPKNWISDFFLSRSPVFRSSEDP